MQTIDQQSNYFIIARNIHDETKSRILLENVPADCEKEDLRIDLEPNIGNGISIEVRELLDFYGEEKFTYLNLEYDGEIRSFDHTKTIADFPLIEGIVQPGIYRLEDEGGQYYLLRDNRDLTNAFKYFGMCLPDDIKFVCFPDKIQIRWFDSSGDVDIERHPLSYFDLDCPFCGNKITGCRQSSESNPFCDTFEQPCSHYAGFVLREDPEYVDKEIDSIKSKYKIEKGELFILNSEGNFEQPTVVSFPSSIESFWSFSFEAGAPFFLFINRDPEDQYPVPNQIEIVIKRQYSSFIFQEK